MGLDIALSLFALIVCNALSPLTTVAFSYLFLGTSLISPLELGAKLFFFFAASGAVAWIIRRLAGQRWIEEKKEAIDGLNVIAVFIFAIAAMDVVPRTVMADPLFALGLFGLIIALTLLQIGLSVLVFYRAGLDRGLVIGLLAGFRNLRQPLSHPVPREGLDEGLLRIGRAKRLAVPALIRAGKHHIKVEHGQADRREDRGAQHLAAPPVR